MERLDQLIERTLREELGLITDGPAPRSASPKVERESGATIATAMADFDPAQVGKFVEPRRRRSVDYSTLQPPRRSRKQP